MSSLQIFLAEDHQLFAAGLNRILCDQPGLEVGGVYEDIDSLWTALQVNRPDLLFLDAELPGMNNLDQARVIAEEYRELKMILLCDTPRADQINPSVEAGMHGCITRNTSTEELFTAIAAVMNGDTWFQFEEFRRKATLDLSFYQSVSFTKREFQILNMLAEGYASRTIAEFLNLSVHTVETHRRNILSKAGCRRSVELIKLMSQNNLL